MECFFDGVAAEPGLTAFLFLVWLIYGSYAELAVAAVATVPPFIMLAITL